MKVTFFSSDPGNHKFLDPIVNALEKRGIKTRVCTTWLVDEEADIYWFDFCDNNLYVATTEDSHLLKGKKVIARQHALEVYLGFMNRVDWTKVHHLIFVCDHLRRKYFPPPYQTNVQVIHNAMELDKWTFKEREQNANLAYMGNVVPYKGLLTFLHYFSELKRIYPEATFHIAGEFKLPPREREWWDYMKEKIGGIYEYGFVDNLNQWLEDKNISLVVQPSCAESFSYILGEAMAKGIKIATNDWYGSDEVWPKEFIYSNFTEFLKIFNLPYESKKYREWVEQYSVDNLIEKICQLI